MEKNNDPQFATWLTSVFGPMPDEVARDLEPEVAVAYLTNLFENASSILASFSDEQIAEGFWYLVSRSEYLYELLNTSIPWAERRRCISSIFTLFELLFTPRCPSHLSHLDMVGAGSSEGKPLNTICYMWWDAFPIAGSPDDSTHIDIDEALLDVMNCILNLPSDTCQESALHGLGHWYFSYPEQVKALIEGFLKRHSALRPDLKTYALAAQKGRVF